jgi:N-acetylglucosaminyldiphosphoundecaprenol N-acetyl-beta-D-mannosaminyltransferase
VDLLLASIRSGRGARVATANLDFVVRARRDDTLRADLAECSMVVADGAPVAWLARIAGGRGTRRVAGVDLVWELAARAHELGGLRFAIYGSEPHILAAAKAHIEAENPGAQIVATMSPPFRSLSEDEVAGDVAALAASRPDVVLIALGCPRQERFIAEHAAAIPGAVWIGVGGTFDFFAGKRRRAPRFLQAIGAEWLARLAQEPRRLWRRYLVDDLPTLVAVAPSCVRQSTRTTPSDVSSLRRALTGADS